ncbi:hypothetical protein C8Q78DRAFT_591201 [Trametes maxima]|nr:hypothetical protein C8Q78DRAFT_591201 [Trametes maxima]
MAVIVCSDPAAARDVEIDDFDIRSLICWRYTNPLVRIDSDTDVVSGAIIATRRSLERTHNFIDRAVWPAGFTHEEHPKLLYNQLIVAPASRDTPNVAAITHDIDKTDDTRDSPKVPAPTDNSDDHHDGEVGEDSKDSNTNNDIPVV